MSDTTVKTAEQESAEQVEELTALRRRVTEPISPGMVQDWSFIQHPKGGDPSEWPSDLRVQEFPEG